MIKKFIIFVLLLWPGISNAAFEDIGLGARAAGMGNAFTGMGKDIGSIVFNPAGVGGVRKTEFGTHFLSIYKTPSGDTDFSDIGVGAAFPSDFYGRLGTLMMTGEAAL